MPTFVLQVTTKREEYTADVLRSIKPLTPYYNRIWVPKKPIYFKNTLESRECDLPRFSLIHVPLFPGYAFIDAPDFYILSDAIRDLYIDSYFQMLGKRTEVELRELSRKRETNLGGLMQSVSEEELENIRKLSGENPGKGVIENGRLRFTEGTLVGMDGYVKKVDRRKKSVALEVDFLNDVQRVWHACDFDDPADSVCV